MRLAGVFVAEVSDEEDDEDVVFVLAGAHAAAEFFARGQEGAVGSTGASRAILPSTIPAKHRLSPTYSMVALGARSKAQGEVPPDVLPNRRDGEVSSLVLVTGDKDRDSTHLH